MNSLKLTLGLAVTILAAGAVATGVIITRSNDREVGEVSEGDAVREAAGRGDSSTAKPQPDRAPGKTKDTEDKGQDRVIARSHVTGLIESISRNDERTTERLTKAIVASKSAGKRALERALEDTAVSEPVKEGLRRIHAQIP